MLLYLYWTNIGVDNVVTSHSCHGYVGVYQALMSRVVAGVDSVVRSHSCHGYVGIYQALMSQVIIAVLLQASKSSVGPSYFFRMRC